MLITEWNDDEYREVMKEEGREEGADRRSVEIAQRMKKNSYPIEEIANVTGLTADEVERL